MDHHPRPRRPTPGLPPDPLAMSAAEIRRRGGAIEPGCVVAGCTEPYDGRHADRPPVCARHRAAHAEAVDRELRGLVDALRDLRRDLIAGRAGRAA